MNTKPPAGTSWVRPTDADDEAWERRDERMTRVEFLLLGVCLGFLFALALVVAS